MKAQVSFRKEVGKPTVFSFRRTDGSLTWSKLNLPVTHDLAHYAVEQTLGFRHGFYGLLDQGFTAQDFDLPRHKRPTALMPDNLPVEAIQTEYMVVFLQTELLSGSNPAFIEDLRTVLNAKKLPYPDRLTMDKLIEIRRICQALMAQWNALPDGQQLDLAFVPA